MKKGLAVAVFVLSLITAGLSITTLVLGACGMGSHDE